MCCAGNNCVAATYCYRLSGMETASVPRLAYSISEAEFATGLSRATLYRLIERGELHTVKRMGRRLVPTAELQRLSGAVSAEHAA